MGYDEYAMRNRKVNLARGGSVQSAVCASCHKKKPAEDFHRCITRPSGLASKCRDCTLAYQTTTGRRYRSRNVAAGMCMQCGKSKPATGCVKCPNCLERAKRLNALSRSRKNGIPSGAAASKKYSSRLRIEVINAYGGKCVCCGEADRRFLTLDHTNNDGASHRRELGGKNGAVYRWARQMGFPPSLQAMCYNCNCGKAVNGGVCPHVESTKMA